MVGCVRKFLMPEKSWLMMPHAIPPASSFVLEVERVCVCNTTASL